jgi:ribosomal-protein-alanine N-acetyltransferase
MLLIRDFRYDDIRSVAGIVSGVFNRHYSDGFYESIHESWREGFLVAHSENGMVGLLAAMISAPKEARILLMAVKPEYRNRGIGRSMLAEFTERCFGKGLKIINLEVRITNDAAIRFYKNQGFEMVSVIPNYYEDGGAGYHMKKML